VFGVGVYHLLLALPILGAVCVFLCRWFLFNGFSFLYDVTQFDPRSCTKKHIDPDLRRHRHVNTLPEERMKGIHLLVLLQRISRSLDLNELALPLVYIPNDEIWNARSTSRVIFAE
jgi:hypothetical protein